MSIRKNSKLFQVLSLALHDFVIITLVFLLSMWLRVQILPQFWADLPAIPHSWFFFDLYWIPAAWMFGLAVRGLYSSKHPLWEEVKELTLGILIGGGLILTVVSLGRLTGEVSRFVIISSTSLLLPILPFSRNVFKRILYHSGIWSEKLAVLAFQTSKLQVSNLINGDHFLGYEVVGIIADEKPDELPEGIPYLGKVSDTETIIENKTIPNIALTMNKPLMQANSEFIARIQQKTKRIMVAPTLEDLPTASLNFHQFFGKDVLLVDFPNRLQNPVYRLIKRIMDLVLVILAAPFYLPIIGAIALAIKLESKGPVFYTDQRVGLNNKTFTCIKFRSMIQNSDEVLEDHLEDNPEARENWEKYRKLKEGDPRITKVGHFLRKTSLDELPQIFCVLKGDMSLVGPRPMYEREIDQYGSVFSKYKNVKPGITGLWQVSGRNELTFADRATLDNWYIKNWSPWLDFVLLLKTIPAVIKSKGAY